MTTLEQEITTLVETAKDASAALALTTTEARNAALHAMADALEQECGM